MARLRKEVAQQIGSRATSGREGPRGATDLAYLAVLAKLPALSALKGGLRMHWHVEELLGYEDEQFVRASSLAVLGREPDASESERYLGGLRAGHLSKPGLLAILASSDEARRAGGRIDGLWLARVSERLARLPLIGRLLSKVAKRLDIFQLRREVSRLRTGQLVYRNAILELLEVNHWLRGQNVAANANLLSRQLALAQSLFSGAPQEANATELTGPRGLLSRAPARQDRVAPMYVKFEDKFRGSRQDIKGRVSVYLDEIRAAGAGTAAEPVIDIVCGRGEGLEVLKEQGLTGIGVDMNRDCVKQCQRLGLEAIHDDALLQLGQRPAASCGAVTAFHMVEHLSLQTLMELLAQARRVLKPGGLLILETPN